MSSERKLYKVHVPVCITRVHIVKALNLDDAIAQVARGQGVQSGNDWEYVLSERAWKSFRLSAQEKDDYAQAIEALEALQAQEPNPDTKEPTS